MSLWLGKLCKHFPRLQHYITFLFYSILPVHLMYLCQNSLIFYVSSSELKGTVSKMWHIIYTEIFQLSAFICNNGFLNYFLVTKIGKIQTQFSWLKCLS